MNKKINNKVNNATNCKWEFVSWTTEMDDEFIRVMILEKDKGNRIGGTFTSQPYTNMVWDLNTTLKLNLRRKHLHNRLRTIKEHFALCYDVFRGTTLSGYSWNPISELIEAKEEVWKALIEITPTPPSQIKPQKIKKKKVEEESDSVSKIMGSFESVADAMKECTKAIVGSRSQVYLGAEVYAELKCIGFEKEVLARAFIFLLKSPEFTQALFDCPSDMRVSVLTVMMATGDSMLMNNLLFFG
ncbi:myb/SANT-like domain-containing protein [Artemisia annua]|uniref:Myb/SANT-like domain-containing protein n=1 Tax=Artemisia annua TaxID=35608 RepID=A0A2U1LAE9_ARTAN|nr:myb/SANT-like domain-containing protein [Artemisia annua]